ncbi:MAG: hypothetical protein ACREA0_27210, partial [bacterium]
MKRSASETPVTIDDPILAPDAQAQYGFGRKWLMLRIRRGDIRSRKVGRRLIIDRGDVERLWMSPEDRDLLARALAAKPKTQR